MERPLTVRKTRHPDVATASRPETAPVSRGEKGDGGTGVWAQHLHDGWRSTGD
jgi:hypothetical protein